MSVSRPSHPRSDLSASATALPTVRQWLERAARVLSDAGCENPALDARLLLSAVSGWSAARILGSRDEVLAMSDVDRLKLLLDRRCGGEPVSRIVGRRAFLDMDLEISPATLDPRPDTELVVEIACARARDTFGVSKPVRVLDLGTGSGAILLGILRALPQAIGTGIDLSSSALEVAQRNAHMAGVASRASFRHGDWHRGLGETFDLVVSNPPYIPTAQIEELSNEVKKFDPQIALDGGPDGLDAYRTILNGLTAYLAPGAWIVFETGHDQTKAVAELMRETLLLTSAGPEILRDLAGLPRCVAAQAQGCSSRSKKPVGNMR
jgi:release factor glutamine methyltransferase